MATERRERAHCLPASGLNLTLLTAEVTRGNETRLTRKLHNYGLFVFKRMFVMLTVPFAFKYEYGL